MVNGLHGGQHRGIPLPTAEIRDEDAIFDLLDQSVGQRTFQPVAGEKLIRAVAGGQNHHQSGACLAVAHAILARQGHGEAVRIIAFEAIDHHHERLHTAVALQCAQQAIERIDRGGRENLLRIAHIAAHVLQARYGHLFGRPSARRCSYNKTQHNDDGRKPSNYRAVEVEPFHCMAIYSLQRYTDLCNAANVGGNISLRKVYIYQRHEELASPFVPLRSPTPLYIRSRPEVSSHSRARASPTRARALRRRPETNVLPRRVATK